MNRLQAAVIIGLLALGVAGVFLWPRVEPASSDAKPSAGPPVEEVESRSHDLEAAVDQVAQEADAEGQRRLLIEVRERLLNAPRREALAAVRAFLASGRDSSTALGFAIGPDRQLSEAPTLRVWVLDTLSLIDRAAAADLAKSILTDAGAPDEWAIALRDFARERHAPGDVSYVQAKMREMIGNPVWASQPSSGFLEAFDTIVYTRDQTMTPVLAGLVSARDQKAIAHAAYLTLDRLVISEPADTLRRLQADPALLAGREQTRANYFARADARSPEQRQLLETYLLDPRRSRVELETFAGLFPNANYMISNNLLTRPETPSFAELHARDTAALAMVEGWLAEARFASLRAELGRMRDRLREFVGQSAGQSK